MLYFLNPGYWTGKGGSKWKGIFNAMVFSCLIIPFVWLLSFKNVFFILEGSICGCLSSIPPLEDIIPDDDDVREEESRVKQQAADGIVDSSVAVQICGLVKTYAGATNIGCCKCKKTSPYHALKVKLIM